MNLVDRKSECTITILPYKWHCKSGVRETLLESASLSGVKLPSSCRNGTCRSCMCQLREGSVTYKVDWPGLSLEEKMDGWILPCVAIPDGDVVIEVPLAIKSADLI